MRRAWPGGPRRALSGAWVGAVAVFLALLACYPLRPADQLPLNPVTEDAFYLLTVARNLGTGHGLSYDGVTPTNGVQPAAAVLDALAYAASPADRTILPLRLVLGLQVLLFAAGALLCGRLAGALARADGPRGAAELLGGLLWLGSYAVFRHAVNGLETGLFLVLLQLWLLDQLRRPAPRGPGGGSGPSVRAAAASGLLLGVAVLARVDASFLVLAACVVTLASGRRTVPVSRRAAAAAVTGLAAFAVSAPWWARNVLLFGDLMPTSGRAEMLTSMPAANAQRLLPALAQTLSPVLPPVGFRFGWAGGLLFLGAAGAAWLGAWRLARRAAGGGPVLRGHPALVAFALAGLGWIVFYVGVFGAPHFVERYLIPLAVPIVPACAVLAAGAWQALAPRPAARAAAVALAAALLAASAAEHVVTLVRPDRLSGNPEFTDLYRRLVAPLPAGASVGSFQSGTLGYFRDRVVNLDGKVNAAALDARRRGALWRYVRARRLDYLADWPEGIAESLGPDSARGVYVRLATAGNFQLWGRIASPVPVGPGIFPPERGPAATRRGSRQETAR